EQVVKRGVVLLPIRDLPRGDVDVQLIRDGLYSLERRTTVRRSHADRSELIAYVVVRDAVAPRSIAGGIVYMRRRDGRARHIGPASVVELDEVRIQVEHGVF